jgi:cell division septation protein DedD
MPSTSEVHSGSSSYWLWILAAFILAFFIMVFVQSTVMLTQNNKLVQQECKATPKRDRNNESIKKALPETPYGLGNPDQGQPEVKQSTGKPEGFSRSGKNTSSADKSSCVIVVGTYKNTRNIEDMKSRVESLGYQAYVVKTADMTRVGVSFDCVSVSPDSFLQQVRLRLQPDAWLLEQ